MVSLSDVGDLDNLVKLHYQCFKPNEHMIMVLGRSFVRDVYKWFLTSENIVISKAEVSGNLVGFIVSCKGPYRRQMFMNNKLSAIQAFLFRPWLVFHPKIIKGAIEVLSGSNKIGEILKKEGDFGHASLIGIHPDYRRSGYSMALIRETFNQLRDLGWKKLIGIAYEDNIASQHMMQKMGFKRTDLLADTPNLIAFTKELDK